jgi:Domain of unknown function (DUF5597)
VCASYTRSRNPLFIPEARASVPNLFWAIGRHAALGYSPFGIESLPEDTPLGAAYKTLEGMIPVVTKYEAEGKVTAVVQENADQKSQMVSLGGYKLNLSFGGGGRGPASATAAREGFALIINTAPDEFVIAGQSVSLTAAPETAGPQTAGFGSIDEGRFEKGVWVAGRRLNGDESGGGSRASIRGPDIGVLKIRLYRYE